MVILQLIKEELLNNSVTVHRIREILPNPQADYICNDFAQSVECKVITLLFNSIQ